MRPSNRSKILDAALRVIDREGVTAVTFESVSSEAGITRGGMLYHFPSRDALINAIHAHLAATWEASMEAIGGKPAADLTAQERHMAYARACAQSATRAELQFMLESATDQALTEPWAAVLERWAPPVPTDTQDEAALDDFIARLAADGLWVYESLSSTPLDKDLKATIAERLAKMLRSTSKASGPRS
ncbi:HTH-type transcriptional regulator BetI [Xanthomonas hydrangeae]|uniref:TetR/AcrR family transcriptional regulator n=1 Tax=Xanthomonas hydrangeae TaxID=2775159 RepID=UPI001963B64D|nr:HTH-type transcriptional regulator BetI [Xanthomonas hydrangeae]CAD7714555.1 HTH-type transcriptional regulator BetI [Xanthomonas hydrangeae]CAD7722500.1 HTH-type transcriptional regulator BetI [Xanthomonas hydrangeae]CAD7722503.1 HTH-type transcriptional regulator BetI [Xanthomonas hydrangeae]CAD7724249.1 HTH-type transcriptional regulator BetI [Xanthomonas hydrangeae]